MQGQTRAAAAGAGVLLVTAAVVAVALVVALGVVAGAAVRGFVKGSHAPDSVAVAAVAAVAAVDDDERADTGWLVDAMRERRKACFAHLGPSDAP